MKGARKPTAERRREIAEEALRILAKDGTAGLTARRVGEAVGISDGGIFKHFANKEAIVDAAVDVFESLMVLPEVTSRDPPLERLRLFFVGRLARIQQRPEILELAFSNSLESAAGPQGAARVRRVMTGSISFVRRSLTAAQREGSVPANMNVPVLTWMVYGVIQAAAKKRLENSTPDQLWSHVRASITLENLDNQ